MRLSKYFAFGFLSAIVVLAIGCDSGPKMGTVSGTVTMDGEPAANLEVSFNPKEAGSGTTAIGYTDASGTYHLSYPGGKTGAPVGDYGVSIVPAETDGEGGSPISVPACYNTATTLSYTVNAGENTANFELKSAGK